TNISTPCRASSLSEMATNATAGGRMGSHVVAIAVLAGAAALAPIGAGAQQPGSAGAVKFVGSATSPISASVIIPANRASIWISGTTPPIVKADAAAGSRERYGDTETQAGGVLKNIEAQLAA